MSDNTKLEQIRAVLRRLNGNASEDLLERLSLNITGRMTTIAIRKFTRGTIITVAADAVRIERQLKTAGLRRELRDIERACKRATRLHPNARPKSETLAWCSAWAKLPDRTAALLWRPTFRTRVVRSRDALGGFVRLRFADRREMLGYWAKDFRKITPKPEIVFDAIIAMLNRLASQKSPRGKPIDEDVLAAKNSIKEAYRELTGNAGGRVIGSDGKPSGRLHLLGRSIDEIFGTDLYASNVERGSTMTSADAEQSGR